MDKYFGFLNNRTGETNIHFLNNQSGLLYIFVAYTVNRKGLYILFVDICLIKNNHVGIYPLFSLLEIMVCIILFFKRNT